METPIKMDDLGVALFSETSLYPKQPVFFIAQLDWMSSDLFGFQKFVLFLWVNFVTAYG